MDHPTQIEPTYLISSHVRYSLPLTRLLDSMKGIPRERIFVAVGEAPDWEQHETDWGTVWRVPHNSFDYTAAIEFCRRQPKVPEWLFLLHDTCEFSPDTDRLVSSADHKMWATAAFGGAQCNFMLLHREWLLRNRPYLETLIGCSKHTAIQHEGGLWKRCIGPRRALYPNPEMETRGIEKVYDGAERTVEFYHGIALKKYKACWGQNMHALEVRP